jgi:hypothetical protein
LIFSLHPFISHFPNIGFPLHFHSAFSSSWTEERRVLHAKKKIYLVQIACSDSGLNLKKGKRDKVKSGSEKRPGSSGLSGENNPSNTDTFIE